jgi:hypothetical protein
MKAYTARDAIRLLLANLTNVDGTFVTQEKVLRNEVGAPLRAWLKLEFSLR